MAKDNEKLEVAIVEGFFLLALAAVDFFGSHSYGLWIGIFTGLAHLATIVCAIMTIIKFSDPNYNKYRVFAILFAFVSIILVMGNRSYLKENKSVIDDSSKNKTEQR